MAKYFLQLLFKFFFILSLRLNIKIKSNIDFSDLNFKENDFINYKLLKFNSLRENFVINTSYLESHKFNFLIFYEKMGGKQGIELSKKNIFLWFKKYKYYFNFPWDNQFSSERFINILNCYDYICASSSTEEIRDIDYILNFHIKRILFETKRKELESITLKEILAETLILCIKKKLNERNIKKIIDFINCHIDENSMHKSFNILEHSKFINNLNEIKNIMLFFGLEVPNKLTKKILAMTSMLSIYRHHDFSLPLFNGCNNNHNDKIQNILNREQFLKNRLIYNLKNGIAAYKDSIKVLFFDVVQPTRFHFDKDLSAGTLAIEISSHGEKIITNCGGTEIKGKNPEYLKYSAAHSTIIINNTNISEIGIKKRKKFPEHVLFEKIEEEKFIKFIGKHNGYLHNFRKICKRKIFIDKKNNIFRGEDSIISSKSSNQKHVYHIRFHLMPNITTTITENKKNIIIRTEKNNMWLFKSNNQITLEKSIFVKDDIALESNQIVISGITSQLKNIIQWSLEKI